MADPKWLTWLEALLAPSVPVVTNNLTVTLDKELDLLDLTINMQGKASIVPSLFKEKQVSLTPPGHMLWYFTVSWASQDVAIVEQNAWHLSNHPHVMMWTRFKQDFPPHYASYRNLVAKGLFRTMPELVQSPIGEIVQVTYYAFIPETALRGEDRPDGHPDN